MSEKLFDGMKEHVLSVRWCVMVVIESGHVSDDTCAHPAVEAGVLVGDTDDDADDGAATSSPHVSYLSCSLLSLSLIGSPRSCDLMLYFFSPSRRQLRLRCVSLWD